MNRSSTLAGSFVALATAAAVHAQARIVYVDQTAPPGGDGSSWNSAVNDLAGLFAQISNQPFDGSLDIRIAQGTYRGFASLPPEQRVHAFYLDTHPTAPVSGATLRITGGWGGRSSAAPDAQDFVATRTILSGDTLGNDDASTASRDDNYAGVLAIALDTGWTYVWLDGLEMTRGGGTRFGVSGSGLYVSRLVPSAVEIRNCRIEGNRGPSAAVQLPGGVTPNGGQPSTRMLWCKVRNNVGGIGVRCAGDFEVWSGEFTDNIAPGYRGGGISCTRLSMQDSIVAGNVAFDAGGIEANEVSISGSLIAGNSAIERGGGIVVEKGAISSSTIVDNVAGMGGGIFYRYRDRFTLADCVLAGNHASVGSAIAATEWSPLVNQSLFQGGSESVFAPFESDEGIAYNLAGALDAAPGFVDGDGADGDPRTWSDNDYRPSARSLLVDRGGRVSSDSDLLGHPRYVAGMVGRLAYNDLGCYESQVTLCGADIDTDGAVTVDDLVTYLREFENGGLLADIVTSATNLAPDNAVTIDDLVYFLTRFEAGC